ncbi:unnamed protein product [Echinostoma caproni]|uniref:DUF2185 domain-containing protein n=1 Tax=Echinostoma caproni TaxID=27848 RepID=A0A183BBS5_9TREM|nr:unnamed protein product [Echinostoma caproni]
MPPHEASISSLSNQQSWLPLKPDGTHGSGTHSGLLFYAFDPRGIPGWSGRILLSSSVKACDIFTGAKNLPETVSDYNRTRWRLGLPEGPNELLQDKTLPLEANGDLSGAIVADSSEAEKENGKLRPLGWLRAIDCNSSDPVLEGLALLRFSEASVVQSSLRVPLRLSDDVQSLGWYHVEPFAPSWWPETVAPELPRNILT